MKTMVIGLMPEYNYPGEFQLWKKNNTKYASNYGACLISQTICKQVDGEFVSDFSDIPALRKQYDRCVLALATHISDRRDVSYYVDIIKQLDMPTYAFSLGIQDYVQKISEVKTLHPSVVDLIREVSYRSRYIGVRGPYTAALLQRYHFKNVIPVGCPTLFNGCVDSLRITKQNAPSNPIIVFHRTLTDCILHLIDEAPLLGQDFLDEVIFKNRKEDARLWDIETAEYLKLNGGRQILSAIKEKGIFPDNFNEWFSIIGDHNFTIGTRLHGCISSIIQGKPALMIARDLRIRELADFFGIPRISIEEVKNKSLLELYKYADFDQFNDNYKTRYANFVSLLNENGIPHVLKTSTLPDTHRNERLIIKDTNTNASIVQEQIFDLQQEMRMIKRMWLYRFENRIRKWTKKPLK